MFDPEGAGESNDLDDEGSADAVNIFDALIGNAV